MLSRCLGVVALLVAVLFATPATLLAQPAETDENAQAIAGADPEYLVEIASVAATPSTT
jgi:hypothetical protein